MKYNESPEGQLFYTSEVKIHCFNLICCIGLLPTFQLATRTTMQLETVGLLTLETIQNPLNFNCLMNQKILFLKYFLNLMTWL